MVCPHNRILNQVESGHNSNLSKIFEAKGIERGLYLVKLRGWVKTSADI